MKNHNLINFFLFILFSVLIFGCAGKRTPFTSKPNLSKDIVTMNYDKFFGAKAKTRLLVATDELPPLLQEDPLTAKLTKAIDDSAQKGEIKRVYVNKGDLIKTINMIADNYGVRATNKDKLTIKNKLFNRIQNYLMVYYLDKEGFIDRKGIVYTPPKIKDGIGNDVIGANVAILWEAISDSLFKDMPVFKDKNGKWMTEKGLEPSVHKYGDPPPPVEVIVDSGEEGISELELMGIKYLSELSGSQSKDLSGLAIRLLGDVQLGAVVIAGHFSIGDNDTLAKIFDELIRVSLTRFVEWLSYKGFKEVNLRSEDFSRLVKGEMEAATPAEELLVNLARLKAKMN